MPTRKRGRAEAEAAEPSPAQDQAPQPPSLLIQIRNNWQFANLVQYIYLFGDALKIDKELDVEELENEFMKTEPSEKLVELGLSLLKHVSSHRGLIPDLFDEYTRRQYVAKAPHRNPFGEEEEPKKFHDFDIFTRLSVLYQLSQWTLLNPDRIREKATDEVDQTYWRAEEIGYDKEGRLYFLLDDNRLYRRTDAAPIEPARKPKANSKAGRALARANKRRKLDTRGAAAAEEEGEDTEQPEEMEDIQFVAKKWECLAVSLEDYQNVLDRLKKSKNAEEKDLRERIEEDALPEILKAEEERQRRIRQKEKELMTQEKMSRAKRSSRIANKQEKEREVAEAEAAERKRQQELAEAKKLMHRHQQMDQDRQSRMQTREQRIKEREAKRILAEQQLEELSARDKSETRVSERHTKAQMSRKRKALEELEDEEEDWIFDCSGCGTHGENLDDGTHSISCEKCKVWQHSACLGISESEAEKDDFRFVCRDCRRKEEEARRPKIPPIKLKLSSSPPSKVPSADFIEVQVPRMRIPAFPPPPPSAQSPLLAPATSPVRAYAPAPSTVRPPITNGIMTNGYHGASPVQQPLQPKHSPPHSANPYPPIMATSSPAAPTKLYSAPTVPRQQPQPSHNPAPAPAPAPKLPPLGLFRRLSSSSSSSPSSLPQPSALPGTTKSAPFPPRPTNAAPFAANAAISSLSPPLAPAAQPVSAYPLSSPPLPPAPALPPLKGYTSPWSSSSSPATAAGGGQVNGVGVGVGAGGGSVNVNANVNGQVQHHHRDEGQLEN